MEPTEKLLQSKTVRKQNEKSNPQIVRKYFQMVWLTRLVSKVTNMWINIVKTNNPIKKIGRRAS